MFFDQLSTPSRLQRAHLPQIRSKIDHTWANLFLEIDGIELQFMNLDEHQEPRRPYLVPRRARKHAQRRKFSRERELRIRVPAQRCQGSAPTPSRLRKKGSVEGVACLPVVLRCHCHRVGRVEGAESRALDSLCTLRLWGTAD